MCYYNYIRLIEELYTIMQIPDCKPYEQTLRTMLDECVMHFFEAHNVPYERQGEFLSVMLYNCPRALVDYKTKKFDYKG